MHCHNDYAIKADTTYSKAGWAASKRKIAALDRVN